MSAEGFRLTHAQDKGMDMLVSDAVHCQLDGGARSGKTFLFLRAIVIRAILAPGSRHAIFRFRVKDVKAKIVLLSMPDVLGKCFPGLISSWNSESFNRSDLIWTLPNGSEIWFAGLNDKARVDQILGSEFATLFFNETSEIPWSSRNMAVTRLAQKVKLRDGSGYLKLKAYYDLNPTFKTHWAYRLFYEHREPTNKLMRLTHPENYRVLKMNPEDNRENLHEGYLAELDALPAEDQRRFKRGEYGDIGHGQLWTEERFDAQRATQHPTLVRVVIAVDPSGCQGEEDKRSDEIGIIAGGLGIDGHGYLLEDLSGRYSPKEWATVVDSAYDRLGGDRVVGEVNFGGPLVEVNLRTVNSNIPYTEVRASRGKVPRAEPVAALDEKGKIHHVGRFPELEEQLCLFTLAGYQGLTSPDRADAYVWLWSHLFDGLTKAEKGEFQRKKRSKVNTEKRGASRFDSR